MLFLLLYKVFHVIGIMFKSSKVNKKNDDPHVSCNFSTVCKIFKRLSTDLSVHCINIHIYIYIYIHIKYSILPSISYIT